MSSKHGWTQADPLLAVEPSPSLWQLSDWNGHFYRRSTACHRPLQTFDGAPLADSALELFSWTRKSTEPVA